MNKREGYSNVLDTLARWTSRVDTLEAFIEQNRELLTDEKIKAALDKVAVERAKIAQARAQTDAKAREFGLIE